MCPGQTNYGQMNFNCSFDNPEFELNREVKTAGKQSDADVCNIMLESQDQDYDQAGGCPLM